jgi:hypothetical protein
MKKILINGKSQTYQAGLGVINNKKIEYRSVIYVKRKSKLIFLYEKNLAYNINEVIIGRYILYLFIDKNELKINDCLGFFSTKLINPLLVKYGNVIIR